MKAAILESNETNLVIKDIPDPLLKLDSGIIDVAYAALNHRDYWIYKGKYAGIHYPIVLGSDLSGFYNNRKVIVNPGINWGNNPNVQSKEFSIIGLPENGSLAEKVSVPIENIYELPNHLTLAEGAALPLAGLTAYRALFTRAEAKENQKIFISGIGGGVALFILQFAVKLGMEVYVSSSHDAKIGKAIQLGAKYGVNSKAENWDQIFQKEYGPMDICIDSIAGPEFYKLVKITKPGGTIVFYGGSAGDMSKLNPQQIFWKQLNIKGSTMGTNVEFNLMLNFVNDHKIKPIVDSIFQLENINSAFQKMGEQNQFGKIVVQINK